MHPSKLAWIWVKIMLCAWGKKSLKTCSPPMTKIFFWLFAAAFMASSVEAQTVAPGRLVALLESTMCSRPGSNPGRLSKVFLPIISAPPAVVCRKCRRSAGRCQGKWLSRPISRFWPMAAIIVMDGGFTPRRWLGGVFWRGRPRGEWVVCPKFANREWTRAGSKY